jgi:hypothetical protein
MKPEETEELPSSLFDRMRKTLAPFQLIGEDECGWWWTV